MKIPSPVTKDIMGITNPEEVSYCNRVNDLVYELASRRGSFVDRDVHRKTYEYRSNDLLCTYSVYKYGERHYNVFINTDYCDSLPKSMCKEYLSGDTWYNLMYQCVESGDRLHLIHHSPFEKLEELLKNG